MLPEFKLTDAKGERLPDGQYTYELRLTPIISAGTLKKHSKLLAKKATPTKCNATCANAAHCRHSTLVQSGSFLIANGSVILPGASEGAAPRSSYARTTGGSKPWPRLRSTGRTNYKVLRHHPRFMVFDQVIPDDLIVQGSICAGLDCVNNENFGFDTIRVKENNTRIQFDDTSTTAGFATNNWQIRANNSGQRRRQFPRFRRSGRHWKFGNRHDRVCS